MTHIVGIAGQFKQVGLFLHLKLGLLAPGCVQMNTDNTTFLFSVSQDNAGADLDGSGPADDSQRQDAALVQRPQCRRDVRGIHAGRPPSFDRRPR